MTRPTHAVARAMGGRRATGEEGRDVYSTPGPLFLALDARFLFHLDAAADAITAKVPVYFSIERGEDALLLPWFGRVFVNPPFSELEAFTAKARLEVLDGRASLVALVCPGRYETAWWRENVEAPLGELVRAGWEEGTLGPYRYQATILVGTLGTVEVLRLSPRVRYERWPGVPGDSPAWPSAVAILRGR